MMQADNRQTDRQTDRQTNQPTGRPGTNRQAIEHDESSRVTAEVHPYFLDTHSRYRWSKQGRAGQGRAAQGRAAQGWTKQGRAFLTDDNKSVVKGRGSLSAGNSIAAGHRLDEFEQC